MNATAKPVQTPEFPRVAPRHSILDLAPLELECMSVLWLVGEGTVRDIHAKLAESRPRAYTTIMTIMDRLARKRVVSRLKAGRAYSYRPQLTAEQAQVRAVEKVVAGFFQGSVAALAAYVAQIQNVPPADVPNEPAHESEGRNSL